VKIFAKLDVWRKPEKLEQVLLCCQADHQGRKGLENEAYPQAERCKLAYQAAINVDVQSIIGDGFKGKAIKEELDKRRAQAIEQVLTHQQEGK
jgi:tRNA nucleotidyltransferase (CCA-adding enzyme)